MSYFVFSIFVKNEKCNLETHISIFSVTLKRKVKCWNKNSIFYFFWRQGQAAVFNPCTESAIQFSLKLEWKKTFLCISIPFQNWKLKKDISFSIFHFQFFFENWKIKPLFFVFQFSFYFKRQNYQCSALIKLTLMWVYPLM